MANNWQKKTENITKETFNTCNRFDQNKKSRNKKY